MDRTQTKHNSVDEALANKIAITLTEAEDSDTTRDLSINATASSDSTDKQNHELRVWRSIFTGEGELTSGSMPRVISFTEIREPLLEEGELEVSTMTKTFGLTSRP